MLRELAAYRNVTVRLSYGEVKDVTSVDFMIKGLDRSPLTPEMDLSQIRGNSREIVEEPTSLGYRVKVIL
jgi:hypothetical protein